MTLESSMQRPLGASILAILLLVLGVAGFGNAYVMSTQSDYGTPVLAVVAVAYGVTALASAAGLWRKQRWAYPAFLAWGAVILLGVILSQFSIAQLPWVKVVAFLLVAGAVFYALARYVRKVSTAAL
jgi:hypothetical protein